MFFFEKTLPAGSSGEVIPAPPPFVFVCFWSEYQVEDHLSSLGPKFPDPTVLITTFLLLFSVTGLPGENLCHTVGAAHPETLDKGMTS